MTDTILCVDIGTSSLKAALLPDNLKKNEIFVSRQNFPENYENSGKAATYWLPALKNALSEVQEKNPDYAIEAICVSGNGPTIVSDDGTTLLHNQICANFYHEQENEAVKKTKSLFIPRIFAFKNEFQQSWQNSKHIFGAAEFLIHALTDEAISILPEERFLPAYWTNSELKNFKFSDSEIKKLPPFIKAGAFAGKISEKAAIETGLFEGTLVFAGAPDFVVALIGTGTVFPGRLCDRAGSTEGLNLCTTKPIFAEGLRTMPSAIPELWNLSYLMQNPNYKNSESKDYFAELAHGISLLREAANNNGEYFPDYMMITGGQALNDALILQKEEMTGLKIEKMPTADAELLGDLILARVALGNYDDITEAVFAILS